MKYFPLIWFGIWRKPVRNTLILLQVAVAFALFGVLMGMKGGVDQAMADVRADMLLVEAAFFSPMPVAYVARIRAIPGVKSATFAYTMGGTYQRPTQHVNVMGLERNDLWLNISPELITLLPKDLRALQNTRTGALITPSDAKKYGWRVGDRIPITSTVLHDNGSGSWVFDVVGTFTFPNGGYGSVDSIAANYDYLDEGRALNKGTVQNFFVAVSDPRQATAISDTIDRAFANSDSQTRTEPFRVRAQQQVQQIDDLNFAIRWIVSAVLVALMFSIATMMMQTVRERIPELAVLKTLGFSDLTVFMLVVVEALIVCAVGALMGLGLATWVFRFAARFLPGLSMPPVVIAFGLAGAVLISLVSASLPASRAAKLQVVDGLAGR